MPGSPTLRNAGPNDRHFAYEVKRAAMREYVERVWGWDEDQQRQLHDRGFREQDVQVITLGGEDVGILSVAESPDCLFVNQLYLLPEHQGQGVGRKCMLTVMERASSLGLPVRLQVHEGEPSRRGLLRAPGLHHHRRDRHPRPAAGGAGTQLDATLSKSRPHSPYAHLYLTLISVSSL